MDKQCGLVPTMFLIATCGIVAACDGSASAPNPDAEVRAAVAEGLNLAQGAKISISESFQSGGMIGVQSAARAWNVQRGGTGAGGKYVSSVLVTETTGEIIITYSAHMPQVTGDTLVLTPNLPAGAALAEGATGALEWACVSATSATATAQRFRIGTPGTVPAQYAPPQCQ